MDEDEEYVHFKVTSDDLEYELDPLRSFRKQTKDQAIYGRLHLPFTSRLLRAPYCYMAKAEYMIPACCLWSLLGLQGL